MLKRTLMEAAVATVLLAAGADAREEQSDPRPARPRWDENVGRPAPPLVAAGWSGTPLSLDALRGNTVVLFFWNAEAPC